MEKMFPSRPPATGVNREGWQTKMENLGPGAFPTLRNLTSNGEACGRGFLHVVGSVSCQCSCGNMGFLGEGWTGLKGAKRALSGHLFLTRDQFGSQDSWVLFPRTCSALVLLPTPQVKVPTTKGCDLPRRGDCPPELPAVVVNEHREG